MKRPIIASTLLLTVGLFHVQPLFSQATGSYAKDLSTVYRAYQQLLAVREACQTGAAGQRDSVERAYEGWKKKHRAFVEELDDRLTAMIRGASSSPQEYSRNVGRYEGQLLQQRNEYRDRFLQQEKSEVERLCREFPGFLNGKDSDLEQVYAEQMDSVRKLRP